MAEHCQSNTDATGGITDGDCIGNSITSANLLIGNSTTQLVCYIGYATPMTGTIYGRVYDSSGTLQHTYGSVDASTLTDEEEAVLFTGGGAYTMSTNDNVVFELDVSAGSARYDLQSSAQSGWKRVERHSGEWRTPEDNFAVKMCITYTVTPSAGGTRLPPSPLIARF
ncbi:MAG TPA: hypothetical protein EYN67_20350 [Flavobacteriales bacterium]|nr:hypothetical protein [Flavobacteriales bacterium]